MRLHPAAPLIAISAALSWLLAGVWTWNPRVLESLRPMLAPAWLAQVAILLALWLARLATGNLPP